MRTAHGLTFMILWSCLGFASASTLYEVIDLGTLGGDGFIQSEATAINNRGEVVGYSSSYSGRWAFTWKNGVMQPLHDSGSNAYGINRSGVVVGSHRSSDAVPLSAAKWQGGVFYDMGAIWQAESHSAATDINDRGHIIGRAGPDFSNGIVFANNTITDLGFLEGGNWTAPESINNRGVVVGVANVASGAEHAFSWRRGKITDLGELPGGGNYSFASEINRHGMISGWSDGPEGEVAVIWQNGVISELGCTGYCRAKGLNNLGQVVGILDADYGGSAFIWQDGVLTDLDTLLVNSSGWEVNTALAINDRGQIVGQGCFGGCNESDSRHAIMLSPVTGVLRPVPEPGSMALFSLGFGLVLLVAHSRSISSPGARRLLA